MVIFMVILCFAVFFEAITIGVLLRERNSMKLLLDYYTSRLMKIVANDTLISESKEILCEAYGLELGELNNSICIIQTKKGAKNEP